MDFKVNYYQMFKDIINDVSDLDVKPKLLLHACCGPCSSAVLECLSKYFDISIYYYNPNIYPENEYIRRFEELKKFNIDAGYNYNIIGDEYIHEDYLKIVDGKENLGEKSERCFECYKFRMEKACLYAKENSFDYFTTTLSISPYKVSSWINQIGNDLSKKYNIKYLFSDFKKDNGYKRSLELSKEFGLYRQSYCGCEFSKKESERVKVKRLIVGNLYENCYILEKDGYALIVDPGDDFERIVSAIGNKKVIKILITHKHFDHIGALCDILDMYKVESLSFDVLNEEKYEIGPFKFEVIFTRGHTSDSVTYYFYDDGFMITGDFLFKENIGRCDLPSGDYSEMIKSLNRIKNYDPLTIVYPGHGDSSNLKHEFENNPYLKNEEV